MSYKNNKLFIVFILGFSSGLPLALITSTLQAWFAESGMSIFATGALSLLGIPFAYKMFWAPLLDRYSLCKLGRRKSWIIATQMFLLIGFNLMAWFNPQTSGHYMAILAFILAIISSTQDMAIDAQRAEYLPSKEYALGASLAVLGYRIAMLLSGGFALVLAYYWGFAITYRFMGFCMIIGIITTLLSKEPQAVLTEPLSFRESFTKPLQALISRKDILYLFLFIFFYKAGEAFTASTSGIVMPFFIQGLGFSIETIGYVNKIMGVVAILLGGISAGFILMRYSLFHALFAFGIFQALTNILFVILASYDKDVTLLAVAVVFDNLACGMGSTALVAFFMRLVDKKFTATQFACLVAISTIPRTLSGPVAATIQWYIGWVGLYQLSVILALTFIPFLIIIRQQTEKGEAANSISLASAHTHIGFK